MATPTAIPEELEELAASKGYRLSWQPKRDEFSGYLASQYVETFDVDVHLKAWDEKLYQQFKDRKALERIRPMLKSDGAIHNIDDVLCIQPQSAFDEHAELMEHIAAARTARRHEDGEELEFLQEQLEKLGVKTARLDDKPLRDYVSVGKNPSRSRRGEK
jgi:hypothetical protein